MEVLSSVGSGRYKVMRGEVPDKDKPGHTRAWYYLLDTQTNEYIFTDGSLKGVMDRLAVEEVANSLGETTRVDGEEGAVRRLAERGESLHDA